MSTYVWTYRISKQDQETQTPQFKRRIWVKIEELKWKNQKYEKQNKILFFGNSKLLGKASGGILGVIRNLNMSID